MASKGALQYQPVQRCIEYGLLVAAARSPGPSRNSSLRFSHVSPVRCLLSKLYHALMENLWRFGGA
jgi:hypothetical protein